MKIAIVVPGFSANENDWCIPAHTDIVRALAREHEVHVFAMRYPHRVATYKIGQATAHSFNGETNRGLTSAQLWGRVVRAMAREHARARFDVAHAIFGGEAGSVAVLFGKMYHVPSVVWMVNGELIGLSEIGYGADLSTRQRWMNKWILRFADCLLFGCTQMLELARARNASASLELLPLGVDLERFGKKLVRHSKTESHFINVGSLGAVKDQTTLLRAFTRVREKIPDARLTIAGVGVLGNDLRALTRTLGISEYVTFAGNVPHDELAELYRSANVFVQASQHEGQGMAVLEAAACGCAVCGTKVGALADVARGGGAITGAVGDANALADAMLRAYTARAGLSARAKQIVESEYNLEHVCARLESLYTRLKHGNENLEHNRVVA